MSVIPVPFPKGNPAPEPVPKPAPVAGWPGEAFLRVSAFVTQFT
jgi:hypothetical protein